jgi:mRNA interferase HigB
MRLLGKKILTKFKENYADSRSQIDSWIAEAEGAQWDTPHDLKRKYPKASLPGDQQVIFNICGNKYRLLVKVNYKNKIVLAKKIDKHDEYTNWKID